MYRTYLSAIVFACLLAVTMVAKVGAQEASTLASEDQKTSASEDPQPDSSDETSRRFISESPEDPDFLLSQNANCLLG